MFMDICNWWDVSCKSPSFLFGAGLCKYAKRAHESIDKKWRQIQTSVPTRQPHNVLRFELTDATPSSGSYERPTPGPVYYKDLPSEGEEEPSYSPISIESQFPDISEETFPFAVENTVGQFAQPVGSDGKWGESALEHN